VPGCSDLRIRCPKGRGSSTLPSRTSLLLQTYSVGGRPRAELHNRCRPNQRMAEGSPRPGFGGRGSRETPRWSRDAAIALTSQGASPISEPRSQRDVWNRPDLVGASGAFHEGRPARLTSHHPGCSVRVNGAGGGMKERASEWASPTDSFPFIGPGSDEPLFSSASHHDPFRLNRSSDPLDAVAWARAAGRLRQRRLISQWAKTERRHEREA
jgi:hypothetical protein